jgi:predicted site-specific integrase-resolvase
MKLNPREIYLPKAGADHLGVSHQTLYSAIAAGHITPIEIGGGQQAVTLQELQRWASNRPLRGRPKADRG